jgi:phosphatidylethanolamine-binding protein (PEBP) family uncharacterized protein
MKTDAFEDGGIIPERYAGRGGKGPPGIHVRQRPSRDRQLRDHLPRSGRRGQRRRRRLALAGVEHSRQGGGIPEGSLPKGSVVGTANVGRGTYFGPGAPAGPRYHHYGFELYALSGTLNLPPDATRAQLLDAMKDIRSPG